MKKYTIHQIVKGEMLIGRNGAYKHTASVTNLIKRGQLKAEKSETKHGPSWLVDQKEIKKHNKQYE